MNPVSAYMTKPFIATAGFLAVFSIIVLTFPLLNYLGYEFSVAVSLVIPICVPLVSYSLLKQRLSRQSAVIMTVFDSTVKDLFIQNTLLLAIPFLLALGAGIFVKNCSFGEGFLFYLLIPAITAFWIIALFAFCYVMFKWYIVVYGCIIAGVLLYPLYLGYFTPAIYSYNFIYGFFPGFSYDEVLGISIRLVLFRYLTILFAIFMLLFSSFAISYRIPGKGFHDIRSLLKQFRFHRLGFIVLLIIALHLIAGFVFRVRLGFESSSSSVQSSLGSTVTTEHFSIYYSNLNFSEEQIGYVAAMHEFHFEKVRAALQVEGAGRITSYIYPNAEVKKRWIGAANTDIAKPWRNEIHMSANSWEGTLRHELVHVLAAEFGRPVIKASYNIGLVEGLATAVDDDFGNRDVVEYAAALKKFQIIDDVGALIRPSGFAVQASSISYVAMGSFCQYLISEYGIDRFKNIYGGDLPEDVYGKSYTDLIDEWKGKLAEINIPAEWKMHVEFFFRRPSIFAKECARVVAKKNEMAAMLLADQKPEEAIKAFRASLETSWNTQAYAGVIRSAFSAEKYDTVISEMQVQLDDSSKRAGVSNLLLLYGDALWMRGESNSAVNAYQTVLHLDLSDPYNEAAMIRLSALQDSLLREKFPLVLFGKQDEAASVQLIDDLQVRIQSPLLDLIKARFLFRMREYPAVILTLGKISTPFSSPVLESAKERLMAEAYVEMGEYEHASGHFKRMVDFTANRASINEIMDNIEKCEWFERRNEKVKNQK